MSDPLRAALEQARDRFESMGGHMKPDWTDDDREALATDWWFGLQEIEAALADRSPAEHDQVVVSLNDPRRNERPVIHRSTSLGKRGRRAKEKG